VEPDEVGDRVEQVPVSEREIRGVAEREEPEDPEDEEEREMKRYGESFSSSRRRSLRLLTTTSPALPVSDTALMGSS
jgi:hypothetical protein